MSLIEDWKTIITKAWSARLALLAALLSGIEVALPYLEPEFSKIIGGGTFAALALTCSAAAAVARIIAQPSLQK